MKSSFRLLIYHISRYGLCNRLRCLAAMQSLAELNNAELRMLWEPGITCPATFESLFEPVCEPITKPEIEKLRQERDIRILAGNAAGNGPESYGRGEEYTAGWLRHSRQLRPLPHLLQRIRDYQQTAWSEWTVGVHVRRTDAVADRGRRLGLTFHDEPIFTAMHDEIRKHPETVFAFATDNQDSLDKYTHEFGDRIRCFPKPFAEFDPQVHSLFGAKSSVGHRHTSMEDAVIDLWLLAGTRHIIGTQASSFSQQAAWIGDIPLQRL